MQKHTQKTPTVGFLDDMSHPVAQRVNNFLALLTLISITALVLETVPALAPYRLTFKTIEYLSVSLFTLEYFTRALTTPRPAAYLFSFYGLVDLAAILPTYFGFGNFVFLKAARIVRILRFLRLLRLFKISRAETGHHGTDTEHLYQLNIKIYILAILFSLVFLGSGMYLSEGGQVPFTSIPASMFWIASVIFGGDAAMPPTTALGTSIELAARFIGIILFGFLIHIVGSVLNNVLPHIKPKKSAAHPEAN